MKKTFIIWALLLAGLFISCQFLFQHSTAAVTEQELILVKDHLLKAVMQCYALQGHYPKNLEELKNTYALPLQEDAYTIFYSSNGDNLFPDIEVVRKK